MHYNIIDLFCGTGSFAQGFVNYSEKFKIVCAIDNNKAAAKTTKANHKDCHVIHDDITKIAPSDVHSRLGGKKIDIILGGPPCQGFSSLRPNRSSKNDDPRNSLFKQFALYVGYFKPTYFILENVVGILTHKNGQTLKKLQKSFSEMGYNSDWKVLNAANFGVPQKRERFILIGARKEAPIQFPRPTHSFNGKSIGYWDKNKMLINKSELARPISVIEAIGDLPALANGGKSDRYECTPQNDYQRCRKKSKKILTLHEAASHSEKMLEIIRHSGENIECIPKHLITSGFSSCYSRLNPDEPATTITVKFTSPASNKCIHPFQNRSITPREAARLQSFDDDFIFIGSKTEIAELIGNAVPSLLGTAIAEPIFKSLEVLGNLNQKDAKALPFEKKIKLVKELF